MAQTVFRVSLHPAQAAVYNSPARFKVVVAGRRFGKSHLAAYLLGMHAMMTEKQLTDGTVVPLTSEHGVYYVAPTQDQAKRILWPKLRQLLGYEKQGGLIHNENTNDGWIELINGRRIYIKGADNPDSLRGIGLSFVVLDEYADMKSFVWDEILSDALADVEGAALFIGTPKGKNHFYRLFMGALEKPTANPYTGQPEDWSDWEAFHFRSTDNPFLSEREHKRMLGGNRSLETIRQEVNADFLSGGGKVLRPEWFEIVDKCPAAEGSIYVTVDLAGFKKSEGTKIIRTDESVVCVTKVIDDVWYVLEIKHGHWDVRKSAFEILTALRKYPGARLGVEQGALKEAVLPYLSEYMREFSRYTTPEELRHNNTKKQDRIAWALQGRAERGRIKLCRAAEWNDYFVTQAADFPDPLAHDDALDALAYVDQMSTVSYADYNDWQEWTPLDQELQTY